MLFAVFLSFASLLTYMNQANVGLYDYNSQSFVGEKLGNVLYYEGTAEDFNGNSSGNKRIEFKLNGTTNNTYAIYFYQTYSDNLHFCYDYDNNYNDHFNLRLSVYADIYYGSTKYYSFNRYYDYLTSNSQSEFFDDNLGFVTGNANPVIAANYDIHITFSLMPISESEWDGYDYSAYQDGYTTGYNDGVNASGYSFFNLFSAIADTPVFFLRSLFNFDLFGMSMITVVLSLLTGLLILGVVKHFWK